MLSLTSFDLICNSKGEPAHRLRLQGNHRQMVRLALTCNALHRVEITWSGSMVDKKANGWANAI
jgi:hypothetical protein